MYTASKIIIICTIHKITFKKAPLAIIYLKYLQNKQKNKSTINSLFELNIKGDVNKHNII